jgi:hypothetical protein
VTFRLLPAYANLEVNLLTTFQIGLDEPPELIGEVVQTLTQINQFIDSEVFPAVKALL